MASLAELLSYDPTTHLAQLRRVNAALEQRSQYNLAELPVTSTKQAIERCLTKLPEELPQDGLGLEATTTHLLETIAPALMPGQAGPRCFGLVTGGVTPASQLADQLVTSFDPCVQVHWPEKTASVALEQLALSYLLSLLSLPTSTFTHNTLTTGATASNLLGLSLGREWAVSRIQRLKGDDFADWSVAEDGTGGVETDVFVVDAHASVKKAAAILGIGRRSVVELGNRELEEKEGRIGCFDLEKLEEQLRSNAEKGRASIVATSFGEVNTGAIGSDTPSVRALCDMYHAWLHIDAAFGAFAVLHPDYEAYAPHLAMGDSITSDAHNNVPYDCGLFFSRSRPLPSPSSSSSGASASLFTITGPGASAPAYLASGGPSTDVEEVRKYPKVENSKRLVSPLFMGVENSRRFRALPVLASLLSLGRSGYAALIARNIAFARRVDAFLRAHTGYDVLTPLPASSAPEDVKKDPYAFRVLNVVIFAPSSSAPKRFTTPSEGNPDPASTFLEALNASNEVFLTPSTWRGRKAVRLAVSNWGTELVEGREWEVVRGVLEGVMRE
ncbi:hypothetical protein JCM8097_003036 [Rhodosporidiobolus ruineniae]